MNFINPIEVLGLSSTPTADIDSGVIKKAKRRVLAEIELSDNGQLAYANGGLLKSDIERITADLDDPNKIKFYQLIANNRALNDFLTRGDTRFFTGFQQEVNNASAFIKFISPYFAEKYDKILSENFNGLGGADAAKCRAVIKSMLTVAPLVTATDMDVAFRSVCNTLKERMAEIEKIALDFQRNKAGGKTGDLQAVFKKMTTYFDVHVINLLPQSLQGLRNQIAMCIRNLSVSIFNNCDDSETSLKVSEYASKLNLDGMAKQKVDEDYQQITEINKQRLCWFCGKNAVDPDRSIKKTIYRVTDRQTYFTGTSIQSRVQFVSRSIEIPRCKHCAITHSVSAVLSHFFAFICSITALIGEHPRVLAGLIVGITAYILVWSGIKYICLGSRKVKGDSNRILRKHPFLKQLNDAEKERNFSSSLAELLGGRAPASLVSGNSYEWKFDKPSA